MTLRNPKGDEFPRILGLVQRYVSPEIDSENVAADLLAESLLWDHEPTAYEIRLRCIDAIRRWHRYDRAVRETRANAVRASGTQPDSAELVERLIQLADLTREEKEVVVDWFYKGHNFTLICELRKLTKREVQSLYYGALDKLRSAKRKAGL